MGSSSFKKMTSCLTLSMFFLTSVMPSYAQTVPMILDLPQPGSKVELSQPFQSPVLKALIIHPENSMRFDFVMDKGNSILPAANQKTEFTRLIKYFLVSLTMPEKEMWVNLSPYEKDRMIPTVFGRTEMGRDLLAQDYLLKQITATLMSPDKEPGKTFWAKLYKESREKFGTTNIPVNTFNKVWIVPDAADIYESGNTAYILRSHLKVMLEEDYLSLSKHVSKGSTLSQTSVIASPQGEAISKITTKSNEIATRPTVARNDVNAIGSQLIRQTILPTLEKEVNEGQNFALLRQIVNSMVLATWFKAALRTSLLGKIYMDRGKVVGLGIQKHGSPIKTFGDDIDSMDVNVIYQRYLKAFKKGVFNFIKEDHDTLTGETIPRKYFSGGFVALQRVNRIIPGNPDDDQAMQADAKRLTGHDRALIATVDLRDPAMNAEKSEKNGTAPEQGHAQIDAQETNHLTEAAAGWMRIRQSLEIYRLLPKTLDEIVQRLIDPDDTKVLLNAQVLADLTQAGIFTIEEVRAKNLLPWLTNRLFSKHTMVLYHQAHPSIAKALKIFVEAGIYKPEEVREVMPFSFFINQLNIVNTALNGPHKETELTYWVDLAKTIKYFVEAGIYKKEEVEEQLPLSEIIKGLNSDNPNYRRNAAEALKFFVEAQVYTREKVREQISIFDLTLHFISSKTGREYRLNCETLSFLVEGKIITAEEIREDLGSTYGPYYYFKNAVKYFIGGTRYNKVYADQWEESWIRGLESLVSVGICTDNEAKDLIGFVMLNHVVPQSELYHLFLKSWVIAKDDLDDMMAWPYKRVRPEPAPVVPRQETNEQVSELDLIKGLSGPDSFVSLKHAQKLKSLQSSGSLIYNAHDPVLPVLASLLTTNNWDREGINRVLGDRLAESTLEDKDSQIIVDGLSQIARGISEAPFNSENEYILNAIVRVLRVKGYSPEAARYHETYLDYVKSGKFEAYPQGTHPLPGITSDDLKDNFDFFRRNHNPHKNVKKNVQEYVFERLKAVESIIAATVANDDLRRKVCWPLLAEESRPELASQPYAALIRLALLQGISELNKKEGDLTEDDKILLLNVAVNDTNQLVKTKARKTFYESMDHIDVSILRRNFDIERSLKHLIVAYKKLNSDVFSISDLREVQLLENFRKDMTRDIRGSMVSGDQWGKFVYGKIPGALEAAEALAKLNDYDQFLAQDDLPEDMQVLKDIRLNRGTSGIISSGFYIYDWYATDKKMALRRLPTYAAQADENILRAEYEELTDAGKRLAFINGLQIDGLLQEYSNDQVKDFFTWLILDWSRQEGKLYQGGDSTSGIFAACDKMLELFKEEKEGEELLMNIMAYMSKVNDLAFKWVFRYYMEHVKEDRPSDDSKKRMEEINKAVKQQRLEIDHNREKQERFLESSQGTSLVRAEGTGVVVSQRKPISLVQRVGKAGQNLKAKIFRPTEVDEYMQPDSGLNLLVENKWVSINLSYWGPWTKTGAKERTSKEGQMYRQEAERLASAELRRQLGFNTVIRPTPQIMGFFDALKASCELQKIGSKMDAERKLNYIIALVENLRKEAERYEIPRNLSLVRVEESKTDPASLSQNLKKGGIDLDSAQLSMTIKRDGRGVALPVDQQDIEHINIPGLVPFIVAITPIKSLPLGSR